MLRVEAALLEEDLTRDLVSILHSSVRPRPTWLSIDGLDAIERSSATFWQTTIDGFWRTPDSFFWRLRKAGCGKRDGSGCEKRDGSD